MKTVWYLAFPLSGTTQSVLDSLLDAKEMGAKTILFTSAPNKNSQAYTETVLVASHSQSSYIQRISAQLPMLILIDLIYAYFLKSIAIAKKKSLIVIGKTKSSTAIVDKNVLENPSLVKPN